MIKEARVISDRFITEQIGGNFNTNTEGLNLRLPKKDLLVLSQLCTPMLVQDFLDQEIKYNGAFIKGGKDTAYSPLQVLKYRTANCFEGALFAYMVNSLHGYPSKIHILERRQDYGHTICVYQYQNHYGGNEKGYDKEALGVHPHFKSEANCAWSFAHREIVYGKMNPGKSLRNNVIGMAGPIDLISRFGLEWLTRKAQIWDIFYKIVDLNTPFRHIAKREHLPRIHPFIRALRDGWMQVTPQTNKGSINVDALPAFIAYLLNEYSSTDSSTRRATANLMFYLSTGLFIPDFRNYAEEELPDMIRHGVLIEDLVTPTPPSL